ncbi:hypothetical protein GJ689_23825 [Rhodoplanes serenus]|jgi:hypothetical protein|uniref:Uncharacterized protein n=1 Tax=Rhodoplanes serenus TaxID=200615 RepID=A0A327JLU6_9BRAD|nr:hypothetical protein [Rhodoplanes serenus]MTW19230.1 hypothetical protein [Rhodoplanes serenus]RAI27061.1 hypothetical protein CH340_24685 [Rhodoplanes serenus]VCU08746.1 hypothetical protein RHODGE_RHODGE_01909 [Rhodoplanes serenus]
MPIDLKSLSKLESLPASATAKPHADDDPLVVMVKLRKGSNRPAYLSPRAEFGPSLFSAEIKAETLTRLEADPAVESVSLSRRLPGID